MPQEKYRTYSSKNSIKTSRTAGVIYETRDFVTTMRDWLFEVNQIGDRNQFELCDSNE